MNYLHFISLKKINSDLLSRIQKITTEIEIVESEKASALLTSQSANYLSSANQSLMNNRIDIEDKIVKFKISKAELEQKLELLQENISQWKQELSKKHKTIQNLNLDLERYTEYRNSIQKVMTRHMQSINYATSANSSFSYSNTARMLDNSTISERNVSKISNRSNSSIIID